MADVSDVENALVQAAGLALFPSGGSSSTPVASVCGPSGRVYRGWPDAAALDKDLRAGVFHVTVYPRPGMERNTTRSAPDWEELSENSPTFTLTAAGSVIAVGGAQPTTYYPQNLVAFVNGQPFGVQAGAKDTPATLASALSGLIGARVDGVSVSGAAITLPSSARIGTLRVGAGGVAYQEVKRQQKQFQIIVWCNSPLLRDQLCSVIDSNLAGTEFLTLADGTGGRLIYAGTHPNDAPEKELLYRRDLFYTVDYANIQTMTAPEIVVVSGGINWQGAEFIGAGGVTFEGAGAIEFGDYETTFSE